MKITISRNALKAVSRFASAEDVRYYLNGVLVQASPAVTRMVATNGHFAGVHQVAFENEEFCDIIIPNDAVKAACALKKCDTLDLTDSGNGEYRLDGLTERGVHVGSVVFKPIDGQFPDYARIIPTALSGEPGHFNYRYLATCQDAADDLSGRKGKTLVQVAQNGKEGAALVRIDDDMFAVVMPLRSDAPTAGIAAWAREPVAVPPKAVA